MRIVDCGENSDNDGSMNFTKRAADGSFSNETLMPGRPASRPGPSIEPRARSTESNQAVLAEAEKAEQEA